MPLPSTSTATRKPRKNPPARRVPLAEGAEYYHVSVKTLRRYGAAGLITLYRVGPKLLQVDLAELDQLVRPVPAASR